MIVFAVYKDLAQKLKLQEKAAAFSCNLLLTSMLFRFRLLKLFFKNC